jgi:hypothetical protein
MSSSSPSGTPSQVLSVRIVSLDYYMAPPIPGLDFSYSPFHCTLLSLPFLNFFRPNRFSPH